MKTTGPLWGPRFHLARIATDRPGIIPLLEAAVEVSKNLIAARAARRALMQLLTERNGMSPAIAMRRIQRGLQDGIRGGYRASDCGAIRQRRRRAGGRYQGDDADYGDGTGDGDEGDDGDDGAIRRRRRLA
jgi:hypothetical protein